MFRCSVLMVAALTVLTGAVARPAEAQSASSWPQFRGPNRDDISADRGLLREWPKDGPPLLWKRTGVGAGFSSVAVAGSRVFTMGNRGPNTYVYALDRSSGNEVWSARVGAAGDNLGCTPTVDGDRLYAIGQEGDLVCVSVADGAVRWRKNFKACRGW